MAQVTVRVRHTNAEGLGLLHQRLSNPFPLLEDLAIELEKNIAVRLAGHKESGRTAHGFEDWDIYQIPGKNGLIWAFGLGDPDILADWNKKAPPGTIGAFLRWVFEQNQKAVSERREKKRAEQEQRLNKKLYQKQSNRAKPPTAKQQRGAQRKHELKQLFESFESELLKLLDKRADVRNAAFEELYYLTGQLSYRGYTYKFLRRKAIKSITKEIYRGGKSARELYSKLDVSELSYAFHDIFTFARYTYYAKSRIHKEEWSKIFTTKTTKDIYSNLKARQRLDEMLNKIYRKSRIPRKK